MQILGLLGKYFVASVHMCSGICQEDFTIIQIYLGHTVPYRKVLPSSSTPFPLSFRLFLLSSSQDDSSPELGENVWIGLSQIFLKKSDNLQYNTLGS